MLKIISTIVLCLLGSALMGSPAIADKKLSRLYAVSSTNPAVDSAFVKAYTQDYFHDIPVMIAIIECESGFRQYEADGRLLMSPVKGSSASGAAQILYITHKTDWSDDPDTNITTLAGNLAYARKMYMESGTSPWNESASCWKKRIHKYKLRVADATS